MYVIYKIRENIYKFSIFRIVYRQKGWNILFVFHLLMLPPPPPPVLPPRCLILLEEKFSLPQTPFRASWIVCVPILFDTNKHIHLLLLLVFNTTIEIQGIHRVCISITSRFMHAFFWLKTKNLLFRTTNIHAHSAHVYIYCFYSHSHSQSHSQSTVWSEKSLLLACTLYTLTRSIFRISEAFVKKHLQIDTRCINGNARYVVIVWVFRCAHSVHFSEWWWMLKTVAMEQCVSIYGVFSFDTHAYSSYRIWRKLYY